VVGFTVTTSPVVGCTVANFVVVVDCVVTVLVGCVEVGRGMAYGMKKIIE
jgi:hypothetical protein